MGHPAELFRVIAQFEVGENPSGHNIRTHDWTSLVSQDGEPVAPTTHDFSQGLGKP